ncbi:MAG: zinc ribbon domain-containing protein [Chloroflexi bacterium]|nr:zinc ribbon domain-containing protein [Chloroflexota bacterium]
MPIYEYRCKKCSQVFALMRPVAKADARAQCASCGSTAVKRQLSRFAVVGAGDGGGGDALDMGGGDDFGGGFGDDDFGDDDW